MNHYCSQRVRDVAHVRPVQQRSNADHFQTTSRSSWVKLHMNDAQWDSSSRSLRYLIFTGHFDSAWKESTSGLRSFHGVTCDT